MDVQSIIARLNSIKSEIDDMQFGVTDVRIALDILADGGNPPPTQAELSTISAECNRVIALDDETDTLINQYRQLTGHAPRIHPTGYYSA